ncbi:MAG TPA: hypothetical protein DCZ91_19810 [Lachnospiraceae bacterium]|nr:hypothetical protein [Lachnospiraceae bacterium]
MRVSVCVGNYAKEPYRIPGLEMNVFSVEELCYCIKENAFLLDLTLLDDGLLDWMERECGLGELAKRLHPLVHRRGQLSEFAVAILRYVGFYDEEAIGETEQALKQGAGLSGIEKRRNQIDYLVRKKKYRSALRGYDELLQNWQVQENGEAAGPAPDFQAEIWHNKGVAYTGLMLYESAAECFRQAYELSRDEAYCVDYLAAKRMLLSEKAYVDFAAGCTEWYPQTQELEKKYREAVEEWEKHPDCLKLNHRRDLKSRDIQKYNEENERLVQVLKDSYRCS